MKKKTNNILAVILIILGIVMLFPIYILFMVSFRNEKTVFVGSLITASPSFESIKSAITPDFLVAIGNSFLIAVAVTIIALILHSMCGYAFARMNFPGKKPMFTVIISTLMIPVSSILVPLFMICKQLGMRFNPCVPEIFKEIEIQNLNYQSAKLTVKISGTGTVECVILDDEKVDFIPYSLTGNHIVHIKLTETESECI